MDTPLLTAETYQAMRCQQITDEEVFAAFHSPFVKQTANGLMVGVAHLPGKTVWALYREQDTTPPIILLCQAAYTAVLPIDRFF